MHGAGQARMARMHIGQPFGGDQAERGFEPGHVRQRRRAAELAIRVIALATLPVPVEARRGVALRRLHGPRVGRHEGQTGMNHQALLRGADRHVDAQLVHRERGSAERGDHVDDKQRRMGSGVDGTAQRHQIAGGAAGGVGVNDEHGADPMPGVVAQRRLHGGGVDREAFDVGRAQGQATEGFDLLGPVVGKMSCARHQDRCPRGHEIGDDGFPAAVAVGGIEEDLGVSGLQELLHAGFAGGDQHAEARVGQVRGLARHRVDHFVGHAGGAGRMQQAQTGNAGSWLHARRC